MSDINGINLRAMQALASRLMSSDVRDVRTLAIATFGLAGAFLEERERACRIVREAMRNEHTPLVERIEDAIRRDP